MDAHTRAHERTHTHTGLGKVSRIYPNRPLQAMNGCVEINFFLVISAGKPAFHIDANQRTLGTYPTRVICINKTQTTCACAREHGAHASMERSAEVRRVGRWCVARLCGRGPVLCLILEEL